MSFKTFLLIILVILLFGALGYILYQMDKSDELATKYEHLKKDYHVKEVETEVLRGTLGKEPEAVQPVQPEKKTDVEDLRRLFDEKAEQLRKKEKALNDKEKGLAANEQDLKNFEEKLKKRALEE